MKKPKAFKDNGSFNIRVNDKTIYRDYITQKRHSFGPEIWIESSGLALKLKSAKKFQAWLKVAIKYLETKEREKR